MERLANRNVLCRGKDLGGEFGGASAAAAAAAASSSSSSEH